MEASRAAPTRRQRKSLRQPEPLRLASETDPAFEQLYRRHAREVYQYALALLTNPADAEDVTQTTFMNAYRAYQRGERPKRAHNWLIAIAHNVCRMRWRQASHRPREVPLEEASEPAALDQEHTNLDEVLAALARLSFNQRAALVMRELEGRSYREIASTLGLSMSAVEALIFRARRNLQLRRRALGVLTTAPLPGSLSSLLGAGGGAVAVGGAAVGTEVVLKAVAILAAGAVTAGVGYQSVKVIAEPFRAHVQAQRAAAQIQLPAAGSTLVAAARARLTDRAGVRPAAGGAVPEGSSASSVQPQPAAEAQLAAALPPAQSSTGQLASTAAATIAAAPQPVPPPPVNVPSAPVPQAPIPHAPVPPAPIPQAPVPPAPIPPAPVPQAPIPQTPGLPITVGLPVLPPPPLK